MTISDIIKSTQDYGETLNSQVNSAFNELIHPSKDTVTKNIDNEAGSSNKNHSIQYAAIGLIALGVIGCISSDSMWPKVSVGTGVILSAYDILRGRQKRDGFKNHTENTEPSVQFSKQETQQKIKDIVRDIKQKWDKFTSMNKNSLISIIDESSASSDVKFVANNTVALARKIQFSILPYVAKVVGTKSNSELGKVLIDIRNDFINNISNAITLQISDYQTVAQKINHP